jgi:hypothetical protein
MLPQIILAIQLSAPKMPAVQAETYAKLIGTYCTKTDIDPYLVVSVAHHESRWNAQARSTDKQDFGLLQIRCGIAYKGNCNDLFNPEVNINVGTYLMAKSRDKCREMLKREPTIPEYMGLYAGTRIPCAPTRISNNFEAYRACLEDVVEHNANRDCNKEAKQ